jgi:hypothetical protein
MTGRESGLFKVSSTHRTDHRCSAPPRELRHQGPDAAQHAVHEDGLPVDAPVGEMARWAVMPRMPRHAPSSSETARGRSTACDDGTTVNSAAVPNGR